MGRMTEILADYTLAFDLDRTRPADRAGATAALRDCFGAHTFRRIDREGVFHYAWLAST